jgi:hypothetical protein
MISWISPKSSPWWFTTLSPFKLLAESTSPKVFAGCIAAVMKDLLYVSKLSWG